MKGLVIFVLGGTILGMLGIFATILRIHGFEFFYKKNKKTKKQKNKVGDIMAKFSVF